MSKTVLFNPMVEFQSNVDEIHLELKSFKIDHNCNGTVKTTEELLQQYVQTCTDNNETIFQSTLDSGITLLMLTAFYGCTKLADVILNRTGEVNKTSKKGLTALMLCSHQGHVETAETLINNGADVNAADENGMTAFMNSSMNGHIKVSALLIDRGANINCVNTQGYSALYMAFLKGHFDVVKLILRQLSMVKNGFLEAKKIFRQQIGDVMIEESDAGTSRGLLAQHFPRDWVKDGKIGKGFSCRVYLVKDNSTSSESQYVVKEIKLTSTKSTNYLKLFKTELDALFLLNDHSRIVPFYGYLINKSMASIFLGYMKEGSLDDYYSKKDLNDSDYFNFTKQILEGLEYLHEQGVIHLDLKGKNILLESESNIRLTDFGISKTVHENSKYPMALGTYRWMAPEVINTKINQGRYSFEADIWSLGCVLVEMITKKHPYGSVSNNGRVVYMTAKGQRPELPQNDTVSKWILDFFDETFIVDPKSRKSAKTLLKDFFKTNWMALILIRQQDRQLSRL
ncbi:MAP kinase kinase kinase Byr2 [Bulinus truncatus]|nr:MAP kinase kinase kinase Byr2 [Bulinus truncatus]